MRVVRSLDPTGALSLTPRALTAAADRVAGPDLCPDEVREPLALMADDLAAHPPTALGALIVRTAVVGALVSRRRLQRAEAATRPQLPPIVIVGWYRTGTTALQHLLGVLPGYGHIPMHRLAEPVPQRGSRLRASVGTRLLSLLAPELTVLHPVTATGPEECWMLLATHLVVDGMAFHWHLPTFGAWLQRVDRRPVYRTWAKAAALLEADLGHALVLKDPAHLLGLPELLEAVPDARLVWTHRDQEEAIASYRTLTAVQHRTVYGRVDLERAEAVCREQYTAYTDRGTAARARLGGRARIADVSIADLRTAPVAAIEGLCSALDLPFDADALRLASRAQAGTRGSTPP